MVLLRKNFGSIRQKPEKCGPKSDFAQRRLFKDIDPSKLAPSLIAFTFASFTEMEMDVYIVVSFIGGDCDQTFRDLADLLGWNNDLHELIEAGERFVDSLDNFAHMVPAPDVLNVVPEEKVRCMFSQKTNK